MYTYQQQQSLYLLSQLPGGLLTNLTNLPVLGSFHVSDVVLNSFGRVPAALSKNTLNIMSTYIAFMNSQDPNNHGLEGLPEWPTWDPEGKAMFKYQESGPVIIKDDYREEQMGFVNRNADTYVY